LDAAFLKEKNSKCQVFIFEITDGNNNIVPLAIGIFHTESAENYTYFVTALM
jgi:hypothetical protein